MTIEIDTRKAQAALESLHDALVGQGKDASTLLKDEARLLSKQIVAFVPPIGGNAKQTGEQAISNELSNLFSEATPTLIDEVGSVHGMSDIDNVWITSKAGQDIELLFEHIDPTGSRMEQYHEDYRDKHTGKVKKVRSQPGKWSARVVVPTGTLEPFIRKVQAHVGAWKASWAVAGSLLGQKYPAWISRHFASSAKALGVADVSQADNPTYPVVIMGSNAPGNGRMRQRIQAAVRARARSLAARTKLVLSGYSKDIAQGMRAQNRARQTHANDEGGDIA